MATSATSDTLSQFFTSFQTNFLALFQSHAAAGLQAAFQGDFHPATLTIPTGGYTSTSITLDSANGDRIVVTGTNFTLTTSSLQTLENELAAGVSSFSVGLTDAMNAINGNGNATFSSLTLSRSGSVVAGLTLTPSALTITSGSDTLTVNGSFPTSLSFLSTTYNDLSTPDGALVTSLSNAALTYLSQYGLTSISASNGTTTETLAFSSAGATLTGNGYTLQLSGILPTNLGQVVSAALEMVQASKTGASSVITGFTLTSASLVDTAGQTIGSINFGGLDVGSLLGGLPSSVQVNFTDTAAGLPGDFDALANKAANVGVITLSDPSDPIQLSLWQDVNDAALLSKISGPYKVEITGGGSSCRLPTALPTRRRSTPPRAAARLTSSTPPMAIQLWRLCPSRARSQVRPSGYGPVSLGTLTWCSQTPRFLDFPAGGQ